MPNPLDVKNMDKEHKWSTWKPLIIALVIGLAVTGWYIFSGGFSYDSSIRELEQDSNVQKVDTSSRGIGAYGNNPDASIIKITCRNGETYEIMFTEDQDDYDELIFSTCGPEGETENR